VVALKRLLSPTDRQPGGLFCVPRVSCWTTEIHRLHGTPRRLSLSSGSTLWRQISIRSCMPLIADSLVVRITQTATVQIRHDQCGKVPVCALGLASCCDWLLMLKWWTRVMYVIWAFYSTLRLLMKQHIANVATGSSLLQLAAPASAIRQIRRRVAGARLTRPGNNHVEARLL